MPNHICTIGWQAHQSPWTPASAQPAAGLRQLCWSPKPTNTAGRQVCYIHQHPLCTRDPCYTRHQAGWRSHGQRPCCHACMGLKSGSLLTTEAIRHMLHGHQAAVHSGALNTPPSAWLAVLGVLDSRSASDAPESLYRSSKGDVTASLKDEHHQSHHGCRGRPGKVAMPKVHWAYCVCLYALQ